jgi:hypothetical protein
MNKTVLMVVIVTKLLLVVFVMEALIVVVRSVMSNGCVRLCWL